MTLTITDFAERSVGVRQHGISLIEAMVAVLLLAILFLGMAHVLARGLVSQRYVNTHNLALLEMREVLQTEDDICTSTPSLKLVGNVSLQPTCPARSEIKITVGTVLEQTLSTALPPHIELSTAEDQSDELFGGVIVISDKDAQ